MKLYLFDWLFLLYSGVALGIYWSLNRHTRAQNAFLFSASLVFIGLINIYWMLLVLSSSIFNYYMVYSINNAEEAKLRKNLLLLSISTNAIMLGLFKFLDFSCTGGISLCFLLPIGISYYTFQAISCSVDIYKTRERETKRKIPHFIDFAIFMVFYPKIYAGPIERGAHFITQISKKKKMSISKAGSAIQLIILGYFLKKVIADIVGYTIKGFYNAPQDYSSFDAYLMICLYSVQIYADFSGLIDVVRGVSMLFGFDLVENFQHPYLSTNIQDFWRKWHMSLSSWVRDYLYIPLGGNRKGVKRTYLNLIIVMFIVGLWHGISINFIIWGLLHGFYMAIFRELNKRKKNHDEVQVKKLPHFLRKALFWFLTFNMVTFAWIFFRSSSLNVSFSVFQTIFSFKSMKYVSDSLSYLYVLIFFGSIITIFDIAQMKQKRPDFISRAHWIVRGLILAFLVIATVLFQFEINEPAIYEGF
ncbi:MAG: MBOAT family O-acyltransferase [Candidatus Hodarchaeota archaeon]